MDDLLIKPADNLMKRLTSITGNISNDRLTPSIWIVQITDIKRVLTDSLYSKILTDFVADTLTGDYLKIFNDYVSNMLVFYSVADFINKNAIMVAAGGNFKHQPENSVVADYKETDRLSKYYRDLGAHFELEFLEYMKNKTDIPEYNRINYDGDSFNCGWQL